MQSQTGVVAVPAAADTWTTVGTETVPAGAKRLVKARFGLAVDPGATASSIRQALAFRIRGSGLGEQDPHEFVGPCGGYGTTTDGNVSQSYMNIEFDVDIPVLTAGSFTVEVNTLDEAQTAGTVSYCMIYDVTDAKAKNSMSQYVDAAVAASADAWSSVGTITVPQGVTGKEPTVIRKIAVGVGVDQGTSAVTLRLASRIRLSGSGISESGSHEYLGPQGVTAQQGGTPVGSILQDNNVVVYDVNIPVKAGGQILVEQRFDTEVLTAGTIVAGVMYA